MSSNEHQRRFRQLYGVGDENPLTIAVIDETVPYKKDSLIFLLVHGKEGGVATVGFGDLRRQYTFAFSTLAGAEGFIREAKRHGFMRQVERLLPMTVGEYFERKNNGWTTADLCLDPDSEMLIHPNVNMGIGLSN